MEGTPWLQVPPKFKYPETLENILSVAYNIYNNDNNNIIVREAVEKTAWVGVVG